MVRFGVRLSAVAALVVVGSSCDRAVLGPDPHMPPTNITAYIGAEVQQNDTAVVVDGVPFITFGDVNRSFWLEYQMLHEYGGYSENDPPPLREESWFIRFSHRIGPPGKFAPYVHHGEVVFADTVLWRVEEAPFVGYGTSVYSRVEYMDGGEITFTEASYLPAILSGSPLVFSSAGSAQAAPFSVSLSARPRLVLTRLANGAGEIDLQHERPVLRAQDGLVLYFDRPLEPEELVLQVRSDLGHPAASAFLRLNETSDRVIISGDLLSELLANQGSDSAGYSLVISEFRTERGAITGKLLPAQEPFALDFVQHNLLRVLFTLEM